MKTTLRIVYIACVLSSIFAGAQAGSTGNAAADSRAALLQNFRGPIDGVLNATPENRSDKIDDLLDIGGHPRLFLEYSAARAHV